MTFYPFGEFVAHFLIILKFAQLLRSQN
jgi:hypothetical protein